MPATLDLLNGWMPQKFWDLVGTASEPPNVSALRRMVAKIMAAQPPGGAEPTSATTLKKIIDQILASTASPNNPKQ